MAPINQHTLWGSLALHVPLDAHQMGAGRAVDIVQLFCTGAALKDLDSREYENPSIREELLKASGSSAQFCQMFKFGSGVPALASDRCENPTIRMNRCVMDYNPHVFSEKFSSWRVCCDLICHMRLFISNRQINVLRCMLCGRWSSSGPVRSVLGNNHLVDRLCELAGAAKLSETRYFALHQHLNQ